MLKVLKNLKKSFFAVIIIIALLCLQAAADLALPDYTSKIVNTGIQSGGIETAVPYIISKENMDIILLFNKDNNILNNYTLIENELNKDQEKIVNKYLGKDYKIEPNTIYILNDIKDDKKQELSSILATPLFIFNPKIFSIPVL